ncbi:OLC1v1012064C1 [Oldenlandia corymbosa var. corymbosa]|uniref:OLC1v1012064C1 n=1 Tax=Oldenlandia corymbosa var. corymbosa TaxID=529605 RepID=A0AAV1DVN4_OLDCO|nr:OLC1v1012064C1 [Oldenlandia corymbosa var. corymbosa]
MENFLQNVFDDLESIGSKFPEDDPFVVVQLMRLLRCVKMFYFCGRTKWIANVLWESALCTMVETIHKHSLEILFLSLRLREDGDDPLTFCERWEDTIDKFLEPIHEESMGPRFEELHQIFSDYSLRTNSSIRMNMEELLDAIDCLLTFLQGFYNLKDLEETIRFLKNFVLFAMLPGVEHGHMGDLLIHVEELLFDAASYMFLLWLDVDCSSSANQLWRNLEPVESHVCEIYVGVLRQVSKLSPSSNHPIQGRHALVFGNFVDSLIFLLLMLLFCGTRFIDIFLLRMNTLCEELRFLRTTLREHIDKVHELNERTHDLIAPMICEAGILIFHLFLAKGDEESLVEKLELLFKDLEEKLKRIKLSENERPGNTLISTCPQTNLLGFIDLVLEKMKSFLLFKNDSIFSSEQQKFHSVYDDLLFFRSFLIGQHGQNGKLQALWKSIAAVAYETEFILDSLAVGGTLQSFIVHFNTVIAESEVLKTKVFEISHSCLRQAMEIENITTAHRRIPSERKISSLDENVVGLNDQEQIIINRLRRGTKQLDIVSIVGMAGLGKTTLARKVYHHCSISHHFNVRLWCTVSQEYNKRSLLLDILSRFGKCFASEHLEMTEDCLAQKLYQQLKGRRYLVILDDVWDTEVWSSLKISFPDDTKGSRILLTSRQLNLVLQINPNSEPHCLRALTNEESWDLFQTKIQFEEGCPSELLARGKAIAQRCKGLPLMILVVAGLLSDAEPYTWEEVEEILEKGSAVVTNQCKETLQLSYRHLPDHLKQCFLYFGAFKEDQQISVRELLWLWIAEGFVQETRRKSLEDVAESYLMELIQRNLVMVAQVGSRGNVKSCVLHDLLHNFSISKGNEEHFMHRVHCQDQPNISPESSMLYRLRGHLKGVEDFTESRLRCRRLRTLLFTTDSQMLVAVLPRYGFLYEFLRAKLLRVLDLSLICSFPSFPCVIQLLVHLKYLAFGVHYVCLKIPASFANLLNLETFLVRGGKEILLPNTLWNMKKLRHLHAYHGRWVLPPEIPENSLENLLTLSVIKFSGGEKMMEVLKKLPNLRRLGCQVEEFDIVVVLDFLSQLESLHLHLTKVGRHDVDRFLFKFPGTLKKLTLSSFCFSWRRISIIDGLPNLEVLKLELNAFEGEHWDVEEEEGTFPNLRFLKLYRMELARWTASDDKFPSLETLVLQDCKNLEELPDSCFAQSSTLQMIKVIKCPRAADSIKKIQEMQMDLGNDYLKILADFEVDERSSSE